MQPRPLPPDARRALRVYRLLFPLVFLALLPGYLVRLARRGNYRQHFGQRLGRYGAETRAVLAAHRWTWIQSISVGETLLALKLVRALRADDPKIHVVLSTTTTTGFALAAEQASDWLQPLYNPIDWRPVVRRALAAVQPERFIVIEGGMWPGLLAEAYRRGVPVSLANARLSPRSERRFRTFRSWTGSLFRLFDCITLPDPEDVARWEALGVSREKLHVTGSIKFDEEGGQRASRVAEFRALLHAAGVVPGAPILVAGSTFPGEEKQLAEMLPSLRRTAPGLLLIVVPRHIERTPALLQELASLPLRVARRTQLEGTADVLVVDTTGELRDWYALATVAFIGKSLLAVGGQNPAEPAMLGKPVVFGPHMENFATLTAHLLATGAAIQASGEELADTLARLFADEALRERMSAAGRQALVAHQGAAARAAHLLL